LTAVNRIVGRNGVRATDRSYTNAVIPAQAETRSGEHRACILGPGLRRGGGFL